MRAVNLSLAPERGDAGFGLRSLSPATLALIGALVLAIAAVFTFIDIDNQVKDRQADTADVSASIAQVKAQTARYAHAQDALEQSRRAADAAETIIGDRYDWPRLFAAISSTLPDQVKLTTISGSLTAAPGAPAAVTTAPVPGAAATPAGTVSINGCAASLHSIAAALSRVRAVSGVQDVTLGSASKGKSSADCPYPQSFDLSVSLTGKQQ